MESPDIARVLTELRRALVRVERRATLGALAGGVGQELRALAGLHAAAVETIAAALDGRGGDAPAAIAQLRRVGELLAAHGARLVQLARPGAEHARPLDLNRAIEDVVAMLDGAGKLRGIEVVLVLDHEALFVTANRTRIEQIVVSLVANAADAIGRGPGKILVATRLERSANGARSSPEGESGSSDRPRVVIEVTDTGPGIAPGVLPQIFEPFFTTKAEASGLGLPVAREIAEGYGGTVRVETTPGIGSTVIVELPASASRA